MALKGRKAGIIIGAFAGLTAALGLIGRQVTRRHLAQIHDRTAGLLKTLIPLEQARLKAWKEERQSDLVYYVRSAEARANLKPLFDNPADATARARAEAWLASLRFNHPEYRGMLVVDRRGKTLLRSAGAPGPLADAVRLRALEYDGVVWAEPGLEDGLPVWDAALGREEGVAAFRIDPGEEGILSLRAPLDLADGGLDIVLASVEGDGAAVIDHDAAAPGRARVYREGPGSLVRRALEAPPGSLVEGRDHLGRLVTAATADLPGSAWRLLFLRELDSAVLDTRQIALVSSVAGAAAVGAAFLFVLWYLRGREADAATASTRLDALLRGAPDPVFLIKDGRILEANDSACAMYGYSASEFTGMSVFKIRAPEDNSNAQSQLRKVTEEGSVRFTADHIRKDGSRMKVEVHSRRLDLADGVFIQSFVRDMSAWAESERRLTRLAKFHEAMAACRVAVSRAPTRTALAEEVCRILNERAGFLLAVVWLAEGEPAELRAVAHRGLSGAVPNGGVLPVSGGSAQTATVEAFRSERGITVTDALGDVRASYLTAFSRANGIRSLHAEPLRVGGKPAGVLTVCGAEAERFDEDAVRLVTALAQDVSYALGSLDLSETAAVSEQALHETRQLLKHITNTLPFGLYIFDLQRGTNVYATPELERILGRKAAEIQALGPRFFLENLHPDDMKVFQEGPARLNELADGEVSESNYRLRMPDASWRSFKSRDVVFERGPSGTPRLILGSLEDVTEEAATHEALEAAMADFRRVAQAVECAAESVVITDETGLIQYINPACASITGYPREEAVGRHTRLFKSGAHPPVFYQSLWKTISSGLVWTGHLVNKRKDGTLFEEDASIAPVKDEHGRITNFVAVKKDVTKERSLESQLQQSQKLEAVGRLAGGVAHDFNNILTAILGYSQMARLGLPEGSPVKEDIDEIEKGARRAADLTRQLLIFSRKQVVRPQLFDPVQVVGGLQKMLRRIVSEDIHLKFVSETAGARVIADPGQFEQVVMNFVVNSRDAMPKGGEVEVAVRQARVDWPIRGAEGLVPPGEYCVLTVRDTGHGIPPEVLPRIFEPFFTTKAPGEGTGLGLSTVYGIVKQAGAFLAVDSTPSLGTVMTVYWPVAAPAEAEEAVEAPARPRGGTETVLLVEDEAPVLELSRRLLTKAGYAVTAFQSPREAIEWAKGGRFDLLLTDVVLPGGFDGKALAEALRGARPDLPVVFTTGYSEDAISRRGVLASGTLLLPKPFTEDALLGAVRDALG